MKKNLMSVIILALVVVNLVLTAILMFAIYPQSKNANVLIEKVCQAIQLDLHSGAATGLGNLPIDQITTYAVSEGADMTINLTKGEDGKGHYAVIAVSLSLNNQSDVYKSSTTTILSEKEAIIKDTINDIVCKYTKEQFNSEKDVVKKEILKALQATFGADYVVGVSFTKSTTD